MRLNLLLGPPGSGKTTQLDAEIRTALENGSRVLLLVPDNETVLAETRMADLLPATAMLHIEVMNYPRLANYLFRRYGGLSYHYLTGGMKACIMWQAIRSCGSALGYLKPSADDHSFVSMMIDACEELRHNGITPERLRSAAASESIGAAGTGRKLLDVSEIYSAYLTLLEGELADPLDDVGKAAGLLEAHPDCFTGWQVFLDSFSWFDAPQRRALAALLRQADKVTVTLPCDAGGLEGREKRSRQYEKSYATAKVLRSLARAVGATLSETCLTENKRADNVELRTVASSLFSSDRPTVYETPAHLRIFEAPDCYAEAEWIAADICRRIREDSLRYHNIAVVERDVRSCAGVLDVVFERFGIPYFMSKKSDTLAKPLSKMILCALSVLRFGWQREDLVTYLRTGLTDVTPEECDLLVRYAEQWDLTGSAFYGDLDWTMNPSGLKENASPAELEQLELLNDIRGRLCRPLLVLRDVFRTHNGRPDVRTVCRSLFDFLAMQHVSEKIDLRVSKKRAAGDPTGASEDAQLWNVTLDALDRLVAVLGDASVDEGELAALLTMLLSETKIGVIPNYADSVLIGSAPSLPVSDAKVVYLFGCEYGVFPAAAGEHALFSEQEMIALELEDIPFSSRHALRQSDEQYYFQRAVSLASEDLIFCRASATLSGEQTLPSSLLLRVQSMFPALRPETERDPSELVYTPEMLRDIYPLAEDPSLTEAIRQVLVDDPVLSARNAFPLVMDDCGISADTIADTLGDRIRSSQSKFETFVQCPFSYYAKYVLRLSEESKPFDVADLGTFMHRILEVALRDNRSVADITDEYRQAICPREKLRSARVTELFGRLRETAEILVRDLRAEFAQSDFRPAFFEYPFQSGRDGNPLVIPLDDGSTMEFYGIADRIDLCKKDGRTYLRIVDYKTEKKSFSLDRIKEGFDLQMLLYLFSACENPGTEMRNAADGSAPVPAGVEYFHAGTPSADPKTPEEVRRLDELETQKIERSGLYLSDPDILRAMDRDLSGHYIPIRFTQKGTYSAASEKSLATAEAFGQLSSDLRDIVRRIGSELRSGNASARPKRKPGSQKLPCEYCSFRPVCRHQKTGEGGEYHG